MSILDFPASVPASIEWTLKSNTQTFTSDLNGATQTNSLPGDRWMVSLSMPPLKGRPARIWIAFLASLRGQSGRFYLAPYGQETRYGSATGNGLVSGANQTGNSIITDGWSGGEQDELLAEGDFFQIGNEMKICTAAAACNSDGQAVIQFAPPIRVSPADNSTVEVLNPRCVMMPTTDDMAKWGITPGGFFNSTISAVEPL